MKILRGLMAVDEHGVLYRPDGRRLCRLPLRLAGWIQRLQHRFSNAGPKKLSPDEIKRRQLAETDDWLKSHGFSSPKK